MLGVETGRLVGVLVSEVETSEGTAAAVALVVEVETGRAAAVMVEAETSELKSIILFLCFVLLGYPLFYLHETKPS